MIYQCLHIYLLVQVGNVPDHFPELRHSLFSSPDRENPLSQVYLAIEPRNELDSHLAPFAGSPGSLQSTTLIMK